MIYKSLNNLKTKRINIINAAAYHTRTISHYRKYSIFFQPKFVYMTGVVIVAKPSHRQRIRLTGRYTRVPVNQENIYRWAIDPL